MIGISHYWYVVFKFDSSSAFPAHFSQAETNDVPSFGGHVISLENILRACQVETTDDIQSKIKRQPFQAEETEDMAMELDEDLVRRSYRWVY